MAHDRGGEAEGVEVDELEWTLTARLATIGYVHRGNLGIALREAFQRPVGTPAHNLYVCDRDSPALANHLALRDYLSSPSGR